jgi:hypothetical protein
MLALRNSHHVSQIADARIRALVIQRFHEFSVGEPYDPDVVGRFVLVEPGDDMAGLESATGCWLSSSLFGDGVRYGDADYVPGFELLEEHPSCFEVVFLFNDAGVFLALLVPKAEGIDPQLLSFCNEFASPA